MSVGGQFKRLGEIGVALGLWILILRFFSSPKRIVICCIIMLLTFLGLLTLLDETGNTHFVNVNSLELFDEPFGEQKMTLEMNDSLILIREVSDDWMEVLVESDTLYLKNNFYYDVDLGYGYKIQTTPFTKWKALLGREVSIDHPKGYVESNGTIIKNGDEVTVQRIYEAEQLIAFRNSNGRSLKLSMDFVSIDWDSILKDYPKLQ